MSKTTIPTGGITADAIDATLIADDAISEEHLDATAITGHTALAETPADTDEFLISDGGVLKRLDASYVGGSDFVRIATSRSSSGTPGVNFDNVFDGSVYEHYRVFGYVAGAVNAGADMYWRTGGSSGSTYTTGDYHYVADGRYMDNSSGDGGYDHKGYNESKFRLATDCKVDGDSAYTLFDLLISDPTTSQMSRAYITGTVGWQDNTAQQHVTTSWAGRNNANVNATGLRFQMESNNINYHHIQLWGFKKA